MLLPQTAQFGAVGTAPGSTTAGPSRGCAHPGRGLRPHSPAGALARKNLPKTTARSPPPAERLRDFWWGHFWRLGVIVSKAGGGDFSKAAEQLPLQKERWALAGEMAALFLVS